MVKVRVNGFGHMGHLVTRTAFNSDRVDTVIANDLKYMVYILLYDSSMASSVAKSRLRMGDLPSVENPYPFSRSKILPTSNGGNAGSEYVAESAVVFTILEKAGGFT